MRRTGQIYGSTARTGGRHHHDRHQLQRKPTDSPKKTLLVDLDLELGEIALLLGVQPRFNFDMVQNFHRMDAELLASYIERHESGVHLLSAPYHPEKAEVVTAEEIRRILQFLRKHYDYLVVDTSKSFSPATLASLEQADLAFVVTNVDLASLRNLQRGSTTQADARPDEKHIRLVVNRYHPDNEISLEDVQRTVGIPVPHPVQRLRRGEPLHQYRQAHRPERHQVQPGHEGIRGGHRHPWQGRRRRVRPRAVRTAGRGPKARRSDSMTANPNSVPPDPASGPKVRLPWEKPPAAEQPMSPPSGGPSRRRRPTGEGTTVQTGSHYFQQVKSRVHRRLIERLNLSSLDRVGRDQVIEAIRAWSTTSSRRRWSRTTRSARPSSARCWTRSSASGRWSLIQDAEISDILVNTYKQIFIERNGRLEKTDVRFQDDRHLLQVIDRIVSSVGRRIDDSSPMVDARLDGSRVNAIIGRWRSTAPSRSVSSARRAPRRGPDPLRQRD